MQKEHILDECIEQLRHLPLVKGVKQIEKSNVNGERQFDIFLDVDTEMEPLHFGVEVKSILKRPIPDHLFVLKKKSKVPILLMAEYINASIANDLKRNQIYFIDSLGNAYIHILGSIYTDIQGRKPDKQKEKRITALFQPKGMQLLFILLTDKEAVNDTIRTLAKKANISNDRAFAVMKELKEKGFILETGKRENQLINIKSLLEKWLVNYGDRLRPKLFLGDYKVSPALIDSLEDELNVAFGEQVKTYAFGGSIGADILTGYYRGSSAEIFIKPDILEEVRTTLKLLPAREANLTLFNLFSPKLIYGKTKINYPVIHPLFIYAELLYNGGGRELDTAKRIYNEYLKQDFDGSEA